MKQFSLWTEGYSITGNSEGACYEGTCLAESFIDACKEILGKRLDTNTDGSLTIYQDGHPRVWGCRVFDNEIDARKSFG